MEKSLQTRKHRQLAELLRTIRIESGLTQMDIAERLGETQSAVSKIESGQRRLDLVQLQTYSKALGVPPEVVVKRWEEASSSRRM